MRLASCVIDQRIELTTHERTNQNESKQAKMKNKQNGHRWTLCNGESHSAGPVQH